MLRAFLLTALLSLGPLAGCGRVGFDRLARERPGGGGDEPGFDGGRGDASAGGSDSTGGSTARDSGAPATGGAGAGGIGAGGTSGAGGLGTGGLSDGGAGRGGAPSDSGTAVDSRAPADSGTTPVCALGTVWNFGFDSDPTLADENGDGISDWVMRNATTFPTQELSGGVWHSATRIVLDSRPMNDFSGKTTVDVRMQSTAVPTSAPYGTVFWVNVNEQGPNFSALFVSVALASGGGQTLGLYGKLGNAETLLASVSGLPEAMVDVHLDVDAAAPSVALRVNGAEEGTYALPITGTPNGDSFATLLLWDGLAEFDSVRIVSCPP